MNIKLQLQVILLHILSQSIKETYISAKFVTKNSIMLALAPYLNIRRYMKIKVTNVIYAHIQQGGNPIFQDIRRHFILLKRFNVTYVTTRLKLLMVYLFMLNVFIKLENLLAVRFVPFKLFINNI